MTSRPEHFGHNRDGDGIDVWPIKVPIPDSSTTRPKVIPDQKDEERHTGGRRLVRDNVVDSTGDSGDPDLKDGKLSEGVHVCGPRRASHGP